MPSSASDRHTRPTAPNETGGNRVTLLRRPRYPDGHLGGRPAIAIARSEATILLARMDQAAPILAEGIRRMGQGLKGCQGRLGRETACKTRPIRPTTVGTRAGPPLLVLPSVRPCLGAVAAPVPLSAASGAYGDIVVAAVAVAAALPVPRLGAARRRTIP